LSDKIEANLKIAAAMRAVRNALGVNQEEFAELIGISKPTVARVETLEVSMKLEMYTNILKRLKKMGIKVDTIYSDSVHVEFEPRALEILRENLADASKRRQGRSQTGIGIESDRYHKLSMPIDSLPEAGTLESLKSPKKK
tara:strand:+ start:109 stop:531 length:423 start_codon:yes stop_codon:yes gene_type:complete